MVVFIKFSNNHCAVLNFGDRHECSGLELKKEIMKNECLPTVLEDFIFLSHNGRIVRSDTLLELDQDDSWVTCHVKLLGGKGGFGSMLRAIGAQIEKTTNREACRDLSGRRMRDVNDEKKIADWLAKQSEREEEKARLKRERLEKLQSSPRHVFEDSNKYTSQLQENLESVEDALQTGLKSAGSASTSSLGKRKVDEKGRKKHSKKQKLWLEIDEDLSSESDEESDVGSSCSSVANSTDVGSEASSRISTASAQTSESETVRHGENTESSSSLISSTSTSDVDDHKEVPKNTDNGKDDVEKKTSDIRAKSEVELDSETNKPLSSSHSEPLDLGKYNSKEELEALGLDKLKSALVALGLKCGGTLQQRADRLFSIKGIPRDKIDPSLLAKPSGKRQRKGK